VVAAAGLAPASETDASGHVNSITTFFAAGLDGPLITRPRQRSPGVTGGMSNPDLWSILLQSAKSDATQPGTTSGGTALLVLRSLSTGVGGPLDTAECRVRSLHDDRGTAPPWAGLNPAT
jgi:hypothetical protein